MTLKKNFETDKDLVSTPVVATVDIPDICPTCHGEGWIMVKPNSFNDCPTCLGEGVIYKVGRCHV
jgi:DnaJ-class molecular chaperone